MRVLILCAEQRQAEDVEMSPISQIAGETGTRKQVDEGQETKDEGRKQTEQPEAEDLEQAG
jgi:hypothetical protein